MTEIEVDPNAKDARPFTNPWPALITALAAIGAALVVASLARGSMSWPPLLLIGIGLLSAGVAVAIDPRSPLIIGLAAALAFLASWIGPNDQWDSARLALRVLGVVGGLAAFIVSLPSTFRRVVVSIIILLHFGGIIIAVASADGSWLANQMWVYFYRPYLQFMYLNNAYHFYAPEPGPAPLLWFCVEYEREPDGQRNLRWVKVPDADKDGNRIRPDGNRLWPNLEYTRRLSLAESTNFPQAVLPVNLHLLADYRDREVANPESPVYGIPLSTQIPAALELQYREPSDVSKKWIALYARHVARTYRHQTKPQLEVVGIKVYRVTHQIILPNALASGVQPDDPEWFQPYFMGEFDKDGNMKAYARSVRLWTPDGRLFETDRDPLLYWYIPIMRTGTDSPTGGAFRVRTEELPQNLLTQKPKNFLAIHAGDTEEGSLP